MSQSVINSLCTEVQPTQHRAKTLDGNELFILGIVPLVVQFQNVSLPVLFNVLPNCGISAILGSPFLQEYDASLDFCDNTLEITWRDSKYVLPIRDGHWWEMARVAVVEPKRTDPGFKITLVKDARLPPYGEREVEIRPLGPFPMQWFTLIPVEKLFTQKHVDIITRTASGEKELRVISLKNLINSNVTLIAGMTLGTIELMDTTPCQDLYNGGTEITLSIGPDLLLEQKNG